MYCTDYCTYSIALQGCWLLVTQNTRGYTRIFFNVFSNVSWRFIIKGMQRWTIREEGKHVKNKIKKKELENKKNHEKLTKYARRGAIRKSLQYSWMGFENLHTFVFSSLFYLIKLQSYSPNVGPPSIFKRVCSSALRVGFSSGSFSSSGSSCFSSGSLWSLFLGLCLGGVFLGLP